MTMPKECKCGCGTPAGLRSRFAGDHYYRIARAHRHLARTARFAMERGIPFELTLGDMLDLMAGAPTRASFRLVRRNRNTGFEWDNVRLVFKAPHPAVARAVLERLLARLVKRLGVGPTSQATELADRFQQTRGRCELSGRRMLIEAKSTDADALDVRLGPEGQLALVVRAAGEVIERHGWAYAASLIRRSQGTDA